MINTVEVTKNIHYVGVNDRETHLFENLWPLDKGVSYNAYLINDDKVAVIDTVKNTKMDAFMDKIEGIIGDKSVDYLIINHMEPDHSGAIKAVRERYPNVMLVGNKKTFEFLENFYGKMDNYYIIDDGDTLDLGEHQLKFYLTPMVHWPETMMTYEVTNKVLFSADAFGGFGTLDGGIFDDEVNLEFYTDEIRRYYSNIVGKYGAMVQKALKKLTEAAIDINVIAPTHGPVWRTNPSCIIDYYDRWSKAETQEGVVIVYGSMYGNTQKMADFIARKLSEKGIKNIRIYDASKTHVSYIISDIWRFKGVVLGSCAYNTGLFPSMETVVHKIENSQLKNRYLGIFGTASWSGGGVSTLNQFAEKIKWEKIGEPVEAKSSPKAAEFEMCEKIADELAKKLIAERETL
ncbi:FprA family A-type flavoprotein [Clostridium formicaceticum]|uniref:Anaerobic nitric oxide reductase flavorubredoxin n=1 Tax=Clostridium formicaceticum TaxID=1497 RepID=A0AAC9RSM0_9CLOT|nr:FprA family A-type flavoprotein [Clostridium formicaceticum]AOY74923.1 FprA family A-type flavoprotein [Clostridium formicaceticum]ARE89330.1 Anaerobic nitric oxide reductase flavorubredoxin [Clostridium formicaceticum]